MEHNHKIMITYICKAYILSFFIKSEFQIASSQKAPADVTFLPINDPICQSSIDQKRGLGGYTQIHYGTE